MSRSESVFTPFLLYSILLFFVPASISSDIDKLREFYKSLKEDHVSYIRPVRNQSHPITIFVDLRLHSVVAYDDRSGKLSSLIIISMTWMDELLMANFSREVTYDIPIPVSLIWSPQISIYNSVTEETVLKTSEDKYQTTYLSPNGTIRIYTVGLSETKCDANILYYPMDVQRCEIHFISVEPIENVVLRPDLEKNLVSIVPQLLIKNEEWHITDVKYDTDILYGISRMVLSFTMSRHPTYLFMNFAAPLAYLCFLNFFVFLLPESSGERISYAVTMLLALILYLNMIADRLPNTTPVSLININVVIQLSSSSSVVWLTILTLWMYEKHQQNQPVPWSWQLFARVVSPKRCRKTRGKVRPLKGEVVDKDGEAMEENFQGILENEENITWKDVSWATNRFLFWIYIVFLVIQCFLFIFLVIARPF